MISLNSYTVTQIAKLQTHVSSKHGYCLKITSPPCLVPSKQTYAKHSNLHHLLTDINKLIKRLPISWYALGCTNPRSQFSLATKFCTAAPNICRSYVWRCFLSPFYNLQFLWYPYIFYLKNLCTPVIHILHLCNIFMLTSHKINILTYLNFDIISYQILSVVVYLKKLLPYICRVGQRKITDIHGEFLPGTHKVRWSNGSH